MLRVMIVDDHPIVREGLRGMLAAETDIEVAAEPRPGTRPSRWCRPSVRTSS
ncbi:response regulator transcription factor [Actinomadura luteofluorescens]|uniref:response regulator transcription factor n=1 Tax=Actinomadura luteofluorescens TaxID=46163 RepID=UPI003633FBB4